VVIMVQLYQHNHASVALCNIADSVEWSRISLHTGRYNLLAKQRALLSLSPPGTFQPVSVTPIKATPSTPTASRIGCPCWWPHR